MSQNDTHPPTRSYKQHLVDRLQAREDHGAGYLDAALEEGASTFLLALKDVIDAYGGETMLATKTGLHRVSLHKIASGRGNPTLSSLVAVMEGLDLRLSVAPKKTGAAGIMQPRQPALKAR